MADTISLYYSPKVKIIVCYLLCSLCFKQNTAIHTCQQQYVVCTWLSIVYTPQKQHTVALVHHGSGPITYISTYIRVRVRDNSSKQNSLLWKFPDSQFYKATSFWRMPPGWGNRIKWFCWLAPDLNH